MKHFLQCPVNQNEGAAVDMAITTVGRAKDPVLTTQLIEFLLGQRDGEPKVSLIKQLLVKNQPA